MKRFLALLPLAAICVAPAFCKPEGKASFINTQGEAIGSATLTDTGHGVLLKTNLTGLPEGWHAFHIHEVGKCDPPEFKTAGGHYNPHQKEHGYENPKGSHVGDLPNVFVGKDGVLNTEVLLHGATLEELLEGDGSAIVIHAAKDDYVSDPAGNAGARIACGVIH
ncbi:MAG TPA: superoxide dismutase family protein [Oculatellaceae cyanobacterium]|jgi:Cu-Zn family superoxide dismutase